MTNLDKAKLAQAAEHKYAGVNCGLLDQISTLMSKENMATFIDCRHYTVENIPVPSEGVFVIVNSGIKHELVEDEYNERRAACEEAARLMTVPALRDLSPEQLAEGKVKLSERVFKRAFHVVNENRRVLEAAEHIKSPNNKRIGELMFASHASCRDLFENSCKELDILVDVAKATPGCWGAKVCGGGFGGATMNWVQKDKVDNFVSIIQESSEKQFGRRLSILQTKACPGAACQTN